MAEDYGNVSRDAEDPSTTPVSEATAQPGALEAQWAEYWAKELAAAKRWVRDFHTVGNKVEDRFVGLKQSSNTEEDGTGNFNIFWSNVQVVLAAIFARPPKPEINRAHLDPNDDVARVAATILSRTFEAQFALPDTSPLLALKDAVQDRFVAGLGQVWVRYHVETQMQPIPGLEGQVNAQGSPPMQEIITDEAAPLDYVRWDDFLMSPCRRWSECRWVARRHYFAKSELKKRFGELLAEQVPLTAKATRKYSIDSKDPVRMAPRDQATVYEIWDKEHKATFWKAEGLDTLLKIGGDLLQLRGFFPCPPPLLATHGTRTMLPTPDFMMVRSQYNELEMLAERMTILSEAIRVVGVYDKASDELKRMLGQAAMNQMIPVDNWAMFAEKGGIKGAVDWFPLEMVVVALEKLTQRKASVLQELYEVLGISDLMRGMSVASETATAQKLKAQFGGARISNIQNALNSFVTSAMWLMLEVVSRHWMPETILKVSQIQQTSDAQYAQQSVMMIKQSPDLIYRVSVSTDSMGSPDWNEEKQQRTEFLQAISQFIGMSMPLIQMNKGSAVFLIQILQWAATGFKAGSQIESVLDQALASLQQSLTAPKPPPQPTPEDLERLSKIDKNLAGATGERIEAAAKAMEAGIPPNYALVNSQVGRKVEAGVQQLGKPPQQQSGPPNGGGGRPPGPPPMPPGAPTQAGPIPPGAM